MMYVGWESEAQGLYMLGTYLLYSGLSSLHVVFV